MREEQQQQKGYKEIITVLHERYLLAGRVDLANKVLDLEDAIRTVHSEIRSSLNLCESIYLKSNVMDKEALKACNEAVTRRINALETTGRDMTHIHVELTIYVMKDVDELLTLLDTRGFDDAMDALVEADEQKKSLTTLIALLADCQNALLKE